MRNKLWIVVLVAVVAAFTLVAAGTALAAGSQTLPAGAAYVSPPPAPPGSHLVMDATEVYTNVEDSGNFCYWALDDAIPRIQVWHVPDGSFYAILRPRGIWTTFAGVPSPNCDGSGLPTEQAQGSGTYWGWFTVAFTASSYTPKFGYLGTFNCGGTKADILLGNYSLQQGDNGALFAWQNYFPGFNGSFVSFWEQYRYGCQTQVSDDAGSYGNIVVKR
jgi:hypothetical protein